MKLVIFITGLLCLAAQPAWSADLRTAVGSAQSALEERQREASETQANIDSNRQNLQAQIDTLKHQIGQLEVRQEKAEIFKQSLQNRESRLASQREQLDKVVGHIVAVVRSAAKNLSDILVASPFTAFDPKRLDRVEQLANGTQFPGTDELSSLFHYFNEEIQHSQEVAIRPYDLTSRNGEIQSVDLLTAGPFMTLALKQQGAEPLLFDASSLTFKDLPSKPDWFLQRAFNNYVEGKSEAVPMDLSGGAALDQIRLTPSLQERILQGGPLVWPILLIGVLGIAIGLERLIFLKRVHDDTDTTMGRVNNLASQGQWSECHELVRQKKRTPVYEVLKSGLNARTERRDVLETILQEAILRELPKLERFLPFLGILGAIAPLLGLLGTVTGMIDTFEVINIAGSGDPRMMSGGISTALITTMLGLAVAIPVMLLHSVLTQQVDHIIGDMEEKAVALTNIVFREKLVGTGSSEK